MKWKTRWAMLAVAAAAGVMGVLVSSTPAMALSTGGNPRNCTDATTVAKVKFYDMSAWRTLELRYSWDCGRVVWGRIQNASAQQELSGEVYAKNSRGEKAYNSPGYFSGSTLWTGIVQDKDIKGWACARHYWWEGGWWKSKYNCTTSY